MYYKIKVGKLNNSTNYLAVIVYIQWLNRGPMKKNPVFLMPSLLKTTYQHKHTSQRDGKRTVISEQR